MVGVEEIGERGSPSSTAAVGGMWARRLGYYTWVFLEWKEIKQKAVLY